MSSEATQTQINDLFTKAHSSNERFDYFMCSVAGGLFAYVGQSFKPDKTDIFTTVVTIIALLFLVLSFFCGCRRIMRQNAVTRMNQKHIECENIISILVKRIHEFEIKEKAGQPFQAVTDQGVFTTLPEMRNKKLHFDHELKLIKKIFDKDLVYASKYGIERDYLLYFGFILLLIAKVYQWSL